MIKWNKIEAGEYVSDSERFRIVKTWDRIYGNHWKLYDNAEPVSCKGIYCENTLLDCKLKAETIANRDEKIAEIITKQVDECKRFGYNNLTENDLATIMNECKKNRISVTRGDLSKAGLTEIDENGMRYAFSP